MKRETKTILLIIVIVALLTSSSVPLTIGIMLKFGVDIKAIMVMLMFYIVFALILFGSGTFNINSIRNLIDPNYKSDEDKYVEQFLQEEIEKTNIEKRISLKKEKTINKQKSCNRKRKRKISTNINYC